MVRKVRTRRCAHKGVGGSSVRKSDDIDERVLYIRYPILHASSSQGGNPRDFRQFSQRVKTMGDERRLNPILNLDGNSSKGIFEYAEHFLPMHHGARTTRALVPHLMPPRQPTRPAAAFKHGDGGEQRRPKGRAG